MSNELSQKIVGTSLMAVGAAAVVTGATLGATTEPKDIVDAASKASDAVQNTVQDYLGTKCNTK